MRVGKPAVYPLAAALLTAPLGTAFPSRAGARIAISRAHAAPRSAASAATSSCGPASPPTELSHGIKRLDLVISQPLLVSSLDPSFGLHMTGSVTTKSSIYAIGFVQ